MLSRISLPTRRSAVILTCLSTIATAYPAPDSITLLPDLVIERTLGPYNSGRGQTGSTSPTSFVELQLNLCNSGFAGCYAGDKSIVEAGELIYTTRPNIVTVNEICSNDAFSLQNYLSEAWPKDFTYSVFMPAIDARTSDGYLCKSGWFYGSAVIGRVNASEWRGPWGIHTFGGKYTAQDASSNEQRTFACAAAMGDYLACATQLSSSFETTALAQCKALMFGAVPYLQVVGVQRTVVGGNFNLEYEPDDAENVQKCVPGEWTRKGDGGVQHVIFEDGLRFEGSEKYGLKYTDYDGWLVNMTVV
jgi:hypothetical protein